MRRFIRMTMLAIGLLAMGLAGTYLWITRTSGPTHEALTNLPRMIPVRDFYADTAVEWNFKPSSAHKFIAHEGTRGTKISLIIRDGETLKELWSEPDIDSYFWGVDQSTLFVTREGRLWQVDASDPQADWNDVTPRGFGGWSIGAGEGYIADRRVIYSRDRTSTVSDLYSVDLRGRDKKLIAQNDGTVLYWIVNSQGVPHLRFRRPSEGITAMERLAGENYLPVFETPVDDTFWMVSEASDQNEIIAVSNRGRDVSALVTLDLTTGTEQVIWQHERFDIGRVFDFDPLDGQADFLTTGIDETIRFPLSERGAKLLEMLAEYGPETDLSDMYHSPDGRYLIAELSVDMKNFIHVSFDLDAGTHRLVSTSSFRAKHLEKLPTTSQVDITASDGVILHGLLTRPLGVQGPAPLIVEIHGGPAGDDSFNYEHFNHFLANRGYAVLSVNFRGSTGFGKNFQSLGFGSFGQSMQQDIYDSVQWAIDTGIADPDAVAVMGGSYGGYAAAMSILQRPDMFKTALIEHAMLDVAYQSEFPPHFWGLNTEKFARYFGDITNPAERKIMIERSPVTLAESLERTIMVVAGKRDRIVGFEQSEDFIERVEAAGGTVETLIFEKAGHGLRRWQDRLAHARAVEQFLAEQLGGRSGGWDYMEVAAEWF